MHLDTENLEGVSLKDLEEARKKIDRAIATFRARQDRETAEKIEQIIRESGADSERVIELLQRKKSRPKAKPKYRHRDNPEVIWSGRGKKPDWIDQFGVAVDAQ